MELHSPTTKEETRQMLDLRFANGQTDTITIHDGDTLEIDSLHVTVMGPDEFIQHDRGGYGVVGLRKWTQVRHVPVVKGDK